MAKGKPRRSKLDPFIDKVGVLPDEMIAELAGVKTESVRRHRQRHDIPARWRGQGEPLPNEAAILEEAGIDPAPKQKKAKKRKAAKPKNKKAPARPKAPRTKKVEQEPAVAETPVVTAAVIEPEPILADTPTSAAGQPAAEAEPVTGFQLISEPTPMPAPAPAAAAIKRRRRSKLDGHVDKVGVLPDREVAELAGVTAENVRAYRKRRGIPAGWRDEVTSSAAKATPKRRVASKAKTKRQGKPRRGKLTPYLDQVGITPDARVAELAGTSPTNVRAFRIRHGIPARWRGEGEPLPAEPTAVTLVDTPPAAKPGRKPRRGKLSPYLEELGILTDKQIATKAGTSVQNVRVYRQRHGIPARWRGEGEPLPNEDAILALHAGPSTVQEAQPVLEDLPPEPEDLMVPAAVQLKGYRVKVVDGEEKTTFVVMGKDIVDAARNAASALAERTTEGEVVELKFLAVVLGR